MSWDQYVSRFLSDGVGDAAIFGRDGSLWAGNTSGHLHSTSAATIKALQSNDISGFLQNGVNMGQRKYTIINSADPKYLGLKSKSSTPDEPKRSALVRQISNTIIILEGKTPEVSVQELITKSEWMVTHLESA